MHRKHRRKVEEFKDKGHSSQENSNRAQEHRVRDQSSLTRGPTMFRLIRVILMKTVNPLSRGLVTCWIFALIPMNAYPHNEYVHAKMVVHAQRYMEQNRHEYDG